MGAGAAFVLISGVHIQLRQINPGANGVVLCHGGVHFAQGSQHLAVHGECGGTARVEGGVIFYRLHIVVIHMQAVQQLLHNAFQCKEVCAVAVHTDGDLLTLDGQFVRGCGSVNGAHLVHTSGLRLVVVVKGQHIQHRGQDGGAHNAGVLAQGVQDYNRIAQGAVCRQANFIIGFGADKTKGGYLGAAAGQQRVAQLALKGLAVGQFAVCGALKHMVGNIVEAVEPGHFFRQVCQVLNIVAKCGSIDLAVAHIKFDLLQNIDHLLLAKIKADEPIDPLVVPVHGDLFFDFLAAVYHAVYHIAGIQ